MKNNTILNLFVDEHYLELVTKLLNDFPVVVKKIGHVYRVQLSCYYVGYKKGTIEINYYDYMEKDFYIERISAEWFIRFTIFAKPLEPDDFQYTDTDSIGARKYLKNHLNSAYGMTK